MKKWFEIINKADKAEIWIYEQIGEDFWSGGGVTAKSFQKELSEIKASQIDLHINSPGGEVFDGITIYNLIKQHPANVTTYIDGLAASIASIIALAGDTVIMAENALYMMHNPYGMAIGNADDMRSMADRLDKVSGSLITTYVSKSGKTDDEIREMMSAETWLTAAEAMAEGFADEIGDQIDMAACVKFVPVMMKAKFKNIPDNFTNNKQLPTAREAEKALRDVGFNLKQAKAILAEGYKEGQRDVDPIVTDPPMVSQRDVDSPKVKKDRQTDLLEKGKIFLLTKNQ